MFHRFGRSAFCFSAKVSSRILTELLSCCACSRLNGNAIVVSPTWMAIDWPVTSDVQPSQLGKKLTSEATLHTCTLQPHAAMAHLSFRLQGSAPFCLRLCSDGFGAEGRGCVGRAEIQ